MRIRHRRLHNAVVHCRCSDGQGERWLFLVMPPELVIRPRHAHIEIQARENNDGTEPRVHSRRRIPTSIGELCERTESFGGSSSPDRRSLWAGNGSVASRDAGAIFRASPTKWISAEGSILGQPITTPMTPFAPKTLRAHRLFAGLVRS